MKSAYNKNIRGILETDLIKPSTAKRPIVLQNVVHIVIDLFLDAVDRATISTLTSKCFTFPRGSLHHDWGSSAMEALRCIGEG